MMRWPTCRSSSSIMLTWSRSILPTGTPVQPEITSPTIEASTATRTSGVSPCSRSSAPVSSPSSARSVSGEGADASAGAPLLPACDASSDPRTARMRSTRPRSSSQRAVSRASPASTSARRAAIAASRSPWSAPSAVSRSSTRACTARSSSCRCASSTAGGVACWPSASRAHAVSSTLTALSGS
jgi:hypothetical protein